MSCSRSRGASCHSQDPLVADAKNFESANPRQSGEPPQEQLPQSQATSECGDRRKKQWYAHHQPDAGADYDRKPASPGKARKEERTVKTPYTRTKWFGYLSRMALFGERLQGMRRRKLSRVRTQADIPIFRQVRQARDIPSATAAPSVCCLLQAPHELQSLFAGQWSGKKADSQHWHMQSVKRIPRLQPARATPGECRTPGYLSTSVHQKQNP